jgi:tetratricopeptide (TPR) repeat protein/class 3 adenylate cyclase
MSQFDSNAESGSLEIAHVLFTDIVGYSLLPMEAQKDYLAQLQQIVHNSPRFRAAEASGEIVSLPTGDGMALAFSRDPLAPLQCAIEVSTELKSRPHLKLRMGINSGAVYRLSDVNAKANVAGTGINMAQRVMDCGDAGHILVSQNVADMLLQFSQWAPHLTDLGEVSVKHGVKVHIYSLAIGEIGSRDLPAKLKAAAATKTASEAAKVLEARPLSVVDLRRMLKEAKTHPRVSAVMLGFVAALSISGFIWFQAHRYHPPSADTQRSYENGVAALREGTYLKAANALKQTLANDSGFALAHARLAEAYNELDYYGDAKDELLKAPAPTIQQNLPGMDKRYIEAIRATVMHNFAAAVLDYSAIFNKLPESAKADGYVDLGRAYEKVGDLPRAVASYTAAANRAPQYPAAFMRLGVLEGRQNHRGAAEAAFDAAEKLYRASSNYEGMGEVAYQRGYMNTSNADYPRARELLMQAFQLAKNLHNTQLETRVLCGLSLLETASLHYDEAAKWAREAMDGAEGDGLAYWDTEAQTQLAKSLIYQKGRLADADDYAQRALQTARRNGWPLLAADARFALCVMRNRQDRPNEAIPLAQSALAYYAGAGYFTESTRALILLIRAKRDRAEFGDALKLSQQGLEVEKKSGSPPVMIQLEEAVGSVDLELERFQDALGHFEMAATLARQNRNRLLNYEVIARRRCVVAVGPLWGGGTEAEQPHRGRKNRQLSGEERRLSARSDAFEPVPVSRSDQGQSASAGA